MRTVATHPGAIVVMVPLLRHLFFLGGAVPLGWEAAMRLTTAIFFLGGRFIECSVCVSYALDGHKWIRYMLSFIRVGRGSLCLGHGGGLSNEGG